MADSSPRLSLREIQILRCIATYDSYRAIAKHLGIGNETVKTHMRRLGKKLGISTKVKLALWAERNLGSYVDKNKQ